MMRAGAAGMHIEDQEQAKRCGHRPNKATVPSAEMCDRIKAAVDALEVTRDDSTTAFTVDYAVTGGTAGAGTDFVTLAAGTLAFTDGGADSQDINITVNGDVTTEADETVVVTLSNVINTTGTTVIGKAEGTATLINDDPVPPMITPPSAPTVLAGNVATLTLGVTGLPMPDIQWYEGETGDTSKPVGTNSASFTTPALTTTTLRPMRPAPQYSRRRRDSC